MKPFKVRCSAIGKIMTEQRGSVLTEKQAAEIVELQGKEKLTEKQRERLTELIMKRDAPPELGETARKYVLERFIAYKYGRTKDFTNRFVTKGLMVEEDSITLVTRLMFKQTKHIYRKNEMNYSNEYMTGTPDLLREHENKFIEVVDVKSSWDIFTFHESKKDLNKTYYWQLQGYMDLTDAPRSVLAYCLIDTPEPLIEQEINRLLFKGGVDSLEARNELRRLMIYSDIPIEERMHKVEIERDPEAIKKVYERVKQCKEYFNSLF